MLFHAQCALGSNFCCGYVWEGGGIGEKVSELHLGAHQTLLRLSRDSNTIERYPCGFCHSARHSKFYETTHSVASCIGYICISRERLEKAEMLSIHSMN